MEWLYLFLAIALEIAATSCTKLARGFTRPLPSVGVVVFYTLSLGIFTLTVKKIEVGTAYAVWSGVGTAAIAVIGFLWLGEQLTAAKIFFIGLIIAGAVGLQMSGAKH
jgi:small multidrug resistance pump